MLTPEERRGALVVLALVLIGSAWEATRSGRPAAPLEPSVAGEPAAEAGEGGAARPAAVGAPASPDSAGATAPVERPVSLNRASAAELEALPGIGPVLARRIVEHRLRSGDFRSVEELRAVRGVGPRLLARLRGRVEP